MAEEVGRDDDLRRAFERSGGAHSPGVAVWESAFLGPIISLTTCVVFLSFWTGVVEAGTLVPTTVAALTTVLVRRFRRLRDPRYVENRASVGASIGSPGSRP